MTDPFSTSAHDFRSQAAGLLEPPVIYLPIRHHSPKCSSVVAQIIAQHRPCAVLVEGPPAFDDQIDFLVHPDARMPLAIYSHVTYEAESWPAGDEAEPEPGAPIRVGSYYPFCDYSPELVALRSGREVGARLGFVDLDYQLFARYASSPAGHTDERHFEFSATLSEATDRLGCRDHNELWDQMVEATDLTTHETVAAVLAYGSLARAGSDAEERRVDGTDRRERAMAERIALVLKEVSPDPRPIVVVTGAFHTVALPELVRAIVTGQASRPDTADTDIGDTDPTVVDHGHGLIRYTFERLDSLAGYAAGMPSPQWYQRTWEADQQDAPTALPPAQRFITEVAATLRSNYGDGQPSLPSVVDAFVAAEQLSRLRNRTSLSRNDTLDAMVSCFTKGEDNLVNPVRTAARRAMTGSALGAVPPGTPRVPLAKDFDRLASELGLPHDTTEDRQVHLDVYRTARDRLRSRFLHGVTALGVSYGICITPLRYSRVSGRDVVRERWNVRIDALTDVSLTEASIWGAGVDEAVAAKTLHDLEDLLEQQPSAAALMQLVMTAAQRGVPSVVDQALAAVQERLAVEPSMTDLVAALAEAELLWSAREPLQGSDLTALPTLANQIYVRACQLGARMHETPPQDWEAQVNSLDSLHRAVTIDAWGSLDHELFWAMLADQRDRVEPGILQGAICGLEWRGGRVEEGHVLARAAGHLDAGADARIGGQFLTGLILVARDALWEIDGIVPMLTSVFGHLTEEEFLRRVPAFRSAFAALTPRQTDRLADIVATITGSHVNIRVSGISADDVVRYSFDSASVAAQLELDGLAGWIDQ